MTTDHATNPPKWNVQWACPCPPCRKAVKIKNARYQGLRAKGYEFSTPAAPYVRRLQSLQALGWSTRAIAAHAGRTKTAVQQTLDTPMDSTMWKSKARWISDVYDLLHMKVPTGPKVGQVRNYALRQGWVPPLAWEDIDTGQRATLPHRGVVVLR